MTHLNASATAEAAEIIIKFRNLWNHFKIDSGFFSTLEKCLRKIMLK